MKRLYRSEKNKIVAGIIGGLGEHFDIDPVLMRLAWLLVLLATGIVPGVIVYLIAILVVPKHPEHRTHHEATRHENNHHTT